MKRPTHSMGTWSAAVLLAAAGGLRAQDFRGLWVGDVTLHGVSDANPTVSDLRFDFELQGVLQDERLVRFGAEWRYWGPTNPVPENWASATFDDSAWSNGAAVFGYGNGGEATVLAGDRVTRYFRKAFAVPSPTAYTEISLRLLCDDGCAVYLNGARVYRYNLPSTIWADTPALAAVEGAAETNVLVVPLAAGLLQTQNVVAVELHQVSAADGDAAFDLCLIGARETPVRTILVPQGSEWRVRAAATAPDPDWTTVTFDDGSWSPGAAPLGYGEGTNITVVPSGPADDKYPSITFRRRFSVADPLAWSHLDLLLQRDDGAVVYLNGVEVMRENMPDGAVQHDTAPVTAITGGDESAFLQARMTSACLVSGTNVLAVEVHQHMAELGDAGAGAPTPTPAELTVRAILHVDASNTVRMLKDVIQMWQDGTTRPAPGGGVEVDVPGRYVLLTDESRIPDFSGAVLRDGQPVGLRVSTVGYDFPGQTLPLGGTFGHSNLTAEIAIEPDFPRNPFLHKFHPDHDNLDAGYTEFRQEAFRVTRRITFAFSDRYPPDRRVPEGPAPPGWGATLTGGTYQERIEGLHRRALEVSGFFELRRSVATDVLNE